VRRLTLVLCLLTSAALAQKPVAPPPIGPRLRLTDSVTLFKKEKFAGNIIIALGPRGQVLVSSGEWDGNIRLFDSTGRRLWTLDKRREIANPVAIGWRGDELWISDPGFGQIALVDRGEVTKSLELPDFIRPKFSERKTFPVFERMEVLALLADGSMVVVPRGANSIVGTPGYDEKMLYILKVSEDGIIQQTITKFPSLEFARNAALKAEGEKDYRARMAPSVIAAGFWPAYRVAPDGKRVVIVSVDTSAAKVDTITVTAYGEKGETLFMRKLTHPSLRFTEKQIDSIARERFTRLSPEMQEARRKQLSRRGEPFTGLSLGRDNSVWIRLREIGTSRPIVGIDADGQIIGTLYVPPYFAIRAADRGYLWTVDPRSMASEITRYKVVK
jgi:hypothetical protein